MRVPGTARCMQWRRIPVDCSLNSGVCASPNSENCPRMYIRTCVELRLWGASTLDSHSWNEIEHEYEVSVCGPAGHAECNVTYRNPFDSNKKAEGRAAT